MNGFENIKITNFRGIDDLNIEDFFCVNVFLGQDSSGKTSVLECLLMVMGMSNPDLPQNINSVRARNFSSFSDLKYMFCNLDILIKPEFAAELFDATKRHLTLSTTYVFNQKSQPNDQNGQIPTSETKTFLNTLKMNFDIDEQDGRHSYESSITVSHAS